MNKTIYTLFILMLSVAIAKGQNGIVWGAAMNIAPSASGNDHPRIVVDRSGNPLVIWNNASRCMFSRWNGTAFTSPVLLNPVAITVAGAEWMGPDIAAHGDTVYVVFKQTPEAADTSHIFCVHSFNGGISFSAPVQVDNIKDSLSRFPTITTDDAGHPIVGFMKFDPFFSDSRWVVTRSNDFGNTFSTDVKASGWSDPDAEICDCCPGSVTCSNNAVAMVYRDNKSNTRDTWAGISTDNGQSFAGGMGIDQQNWLINSCPATGPDGIILGDTLYGAFMNGSSGKNLVYYSKSGISGMNGGTAIPLTGLFPGLSHQNYPRIDGDGNALGITWVQTVNGSKQCVLRFTNKKANGFPALYDTIAIGNPINCDIVVKNGKVYVVWEDGNSGTVKYRLGNYTNTSGTLENVEQNSLSIFPNPTNGTVQIESNQIIDNIIVTNLFGQIIYQAEPKGTSYSLQLDNQGIYFLTARASQRSTVRKLVVTE